MKLLTKPVGAASGYSPASRLLSGLPPEVDALIARVLQPEPATRMGSAAELLGRLSAIPLPKRSRPASAAAKS